MASCRGTVQVVLERKVGWMKLAHGKKTAEGDKKAWRKAIGGNVMVES